jgi:hypothetical protein
MLCIAILALPFKSRSRLEAENAALRHQLNERQHEDTQYSVLALQHSTAIRSSRLFSCGGAAI